MVHSLLPLRNTCWLLYLLLRYHSGKEYSQILVVMLTNTCRIYYIRKGLIYVYDQKQKKEETNLTLLRKEQKEKVEELKKKTSYYTTQSLLERYDEVLAAKKKMDEKAAVKKLENNQDLRQRKPGFYLNKIPLSYSNPSL